VGPIFYAITIIIGGVLQPGYSHISQAVSELLAGGAPNKLLLDILFAISHILLILYPIGLHKGIKKRNISIIGPFLISLSSILGLSMILFFPCDPECKLLTFTGIMHFILIFPLSCANLFGMFAICLRLKKDDRWNSYDVYTLISLILAITITFLSTFLFQTEFKGLIQRIGMVTMQQWFFILAIKLFRINLSELD
jgi:hypothetical membrane protein